MKKTFVRVLAVSIAALLFAGCSSEAKTDATIKESWLFSLQSAGTTSFDQSSGVLSMPIDDVVGFTDRPNREARDITSTAFVSMWADKGGDSFSADPPNASLTYWDSDGTNAVAHTVIVEITGNVSNAGNVLSMTLQILSPSGAVLPTKLYRASLFIDDFDDDDDDMNMNMAPPFPASCNPDSDAQDAAYLAGGWASDAFQAARTLYQNCIQNVKDALWNSPECVSAKAANDVALTELFSVPGFDDGSANPADLAAPQAAADNAAAEYDRSCYYSGE